jgi:metal-responsive CopG/Arc/MetJ family transcriptional regulator
MNSRRLSPHQLALLTSLVATPARKSKASITLCGNLFKVIDALAGSRQRSAWIEHALRSYAKRQLKQQRRARELELLNRHAETLNDEGAKNVAYQSCSHTG